MTRTIFALCLALAGCGPVSTPTSSVEAPADGRKAPGGVPPGSFVDELLESYSVPGAAVAVVEGERVTAKGYGIRRAGEMAPVDDRTVFQAASLSKPVVAYGVIRLVEDGRLDLDRPLVDYLGAAEIADSRVERITARIALSHTTGFPNWRPGRWGDSPGPLEIEFDPGERFQYSGEGYGYLQSAVEKITGQSLDRYLEVSVLGPLGMNDSAFVWQERFEAVHASPHDGEGVPQPKWRPDEALAAGTLHTTAADYGRFLAAMLADEPAVDLPLSPTVLLKMLAPQIEVEEHLFWSLGWGLDDATGDMVFWQWGDDGPFKALVAGSRGRRSATVVFTNGEWGLDVARPVLERSFPDRRFPDFRMLGYRPVRANDDLAQ